MDISLVVISCSDFVANPIGGTLFFLRGILKYFDPDRVLLIGGTWSDDYQLGKLYTVGINGQKMKFVPVFRAKSKGLPIRLQCFNGVWRSFKWIRHEYLNKREYVLYAHSPEAAFALRLAGSRRIVLHLHGADNPLTFSRYRFFRNSVFLSAFEKLILKQAVKKAQLVIGINTDCINLCRRYKGDNYEYECVEVPVCTDFDYFSIESMEPQIERANPFTVLYVGRLNKVKNVELLIRAIKFLKKNRSDIKLKIVGSGEELQNLTKLAESLGVKDSVDFMGSVSHDRLLPFYLLADVFVLPSYSEGMSVALLEALACGVPSVASEVGGVRKLIVPGVNGYFIKNFDVSELASKIMLAYEKLHDKRQLIRRTVLKYSCENVAQAIKDEIKRRFRVINV